MTIRRRTIIENAVEGKPLGRHVHHDSRSLDYLVVADGTVADASWQRDTPILDQGQVGSCTGNATVGVLGTDPFYPTIQALPKPPTLNEAEALRIYSAAEVIDGDGPYPPNDNGSSGLSVAKAAKAAGLISGYLHITSLAAAHTAIQTGPFIVGSNWYTGMDTPDADGLVTATGTVRGGHEYACFAYDGIQDLWWFDNSWGTSYGVNGTFCYSSKTFAALLAAEGDATVFTPIGAAPFPAPTPVPVDANLALALVARPWVLKRHTGDNETMKVALEAWLAAQ